MKKLRIKIGDCWKCGKRGDGDKYWIFAVVGRIEFKGISYWLAVKNNIDEAISLFPTLFDECGDQVNDDYCDMTESFYMYQRSKAEARVYPKTDALNPKKEAK